MGSRTPVFPLSNGLNPSFMPTQQRPSRALTELLADQFYLIRQLTFKKLVLTSQFLFARYFLRFAFVFANPQLRSILPGMDQLFPGFSCFDIFRSSLLLDKLFLIFYLELLLGFRQDWLGFLFCVSYRFLFILTYLLAMI
ncbi:Hypothetical_protein [Hexamita inflata]|uniref:Hypothetical_protein n=1 Tax=Hexamita inflata TaxID=28002 RepID=A0ABP1I8V3_9EUKA